MFIGRDFRVLFRLTLPSHWSESSRNSDQMICFYIKTMHSLQKKSGSSRYLLINIKHVYCGSSNEILQRRKQFLTLSTRVGKEPSEPRHERKRAEPRVGSWLCHAALSMHITSAVPAITHTILIINVLYKINHLICSKCMLQIFSEPTSRVTSHELSISLFLISLTFRWAEGHYRGYYELYLNRNDATVCY